MKRKFAGWFVIVMLLCSLLPSQVLGAASAKNVELNTSANITLEKAIQNVKQNFTIPSKLTEFTSSFSNYGEHQRWSLSWSSQNDEDGNFEAEVNAVSGEIVSMHRWSRTDNSSSKTPSLSVKEAQKIGHDLLANLLPDKINNLALQNDSALIPIGTYQSPRYTMTWQRTYQGVNVAMDYAQMEIDMQTGEVSNYYLNWTNKTFPSAASVISSDKAYQVFAAQEILKLQYKMPMIRGQQAKPQLIYGIKHPSNGLIDALTGQPLINGDSYFPIGNAGWSSKESSMLSLADQTSVELSPEEQKEINSSTQYISQAKAIELAKKWLPSIDNLQLESAALEKDWQNPDTRCWRLNWNSNPANESKHSYVWVQLDAATGELLAFNLNLPSENELNNADLIDQKTAQSLAENFIKTIQPQRWSEIKLNEQTTSRIRPLDINEPTWSFEYLRMVNGVICPDNGIEVSIDAGSKQVSSYRLNWNKIKFPSAKEVIAINQANDLFLKNAPLTLNYTMITSAKGNEELKLVYLPQAKNGFYMIDALSGTALNEEGQAITNNPQPYVYNDIKGHFGEKEINLLGQAGILGEYNTSFHPDEDIKLIALLRAMLSAKNGVYSIQGINDEEVFKRCINLNWIDKDYQLNSSVSRELLAQLMIRFLNIDYLSQVQGIYQLPYSDTAGMSPELKAYAALCWGLNIIKADGKTFNSQHTISRAEAATALVHTLSIKTNP